MTSFDFNIDMKRIRAEPGDTIVYTIDMAVSTEQIKHIQAGHRAVFGPEIGSVILSGGLQISEVRPADGRST